MPLVGSASRCQNSPRVTLQSECPHFRSEYFAFERETFWHAMRPDARGIVAGDLTSARSTVASIHPPMPLSSWIVQNSRLALSMKAIAKVGLYVKRKAAFRHY